MSVCTICQLPSHEDYQTIQTAVDVFIGSRNGTSRDIMHGVISYLLKKYCLTKLSLPRYVIELSGNHIKIKPKLITDSTSRSCPICQEDIYAPKSKVTIITINEGLHTDFVTYGCGSCFTVFGKKESNT